MTAALEQKPFRHGPTDGAAEIDSGNRSSGARANAAGLNRNRKGGTALAFLQTCGHQTDDSRVPAFRSSDNDRALLFQA